MRISFICVGVLAVAVGVCASTQPGYEQVFRAIAGAGVAMVVGGGLGLRSRKK
jgi:hypothetical protein